MKLHAIIFTVFVSSILLCSLIFSSCTKNDKSHTPTDSVSDFESLLPIETFTNATILSKSASLCLFGRDSQMHSVIKLSEGNLVSILEIDGKIDEKNVIQKVEEGEPTSEKTYVHAVYDNLDFWIERALLAFDCEKAVVIENAYLFSDSELSKKIESSQNPLKFSTLVGIAGQTTPENPLSVKIFYFDNSEKSVKEAYVSSVSVSSKKDDIVVSKIAMTLRETKKAVARNELFAEAARYKPCKKVLAVLESQKEEKKTYNYQEVLKNMQKMSFGVNVNELLTVDQSKDPFQ